MQDTPERSQVVDCAMDCDHLAARWRKDPFPICDQLREKCPVAHGAKGLVAPVINAPLTSGVTIASSHGHAGGQGLDSLRLCMPVGAGKAKEACLWFVSRTRLTRMETLI
jgi:hypothetical protein